MCIDISPLPWRSLLLLCASYFTVFVFESSKATTQLGLVCNFLTIIFFAAPLATMVTTLATRTHEMRTPIISTLCMAPASYIQREVYKAIPTLSLPPSPPPPLSHTYTHRWRLFVTRVLRRCHFRWQWCHYWPLTHGQLMELSFMISTYRSVQCVGLGLVICDLLWEKA